MKLKDEQGKWTKMSKISGTIAAIVTTLSVIAGGAYTIGEANAWDSEVNRIRSEALETIEVSQNETLKLIKELTEKQKQKNCDYIIDRLNELRAKERYDQMTEYDYVRKDQLEAKLERECS